MLINDKDGKKNQQNNHTSIKLQLYNICLHDMGQNLHYMDQNDYVL